MNPPTVDRVTGAVTFTVLSTHGSVWTLGAGRSFVLSTFLPPGNVGRAHEGSVVGCGGKQPWTYSRSGSLPRGLEWNSAGTVSGTPTTAGPTTFEVTMTDSSKPKKEVTTTVSIPVS